ncbi:MAG: ABC transporter permease [Pseudobdellovibrionaceae bacterium]|nr:ABC transporter permease [Bdellovibrionales bacterium]USN49028.1 MAG: ABC transporter permease [Pseudobdellovibrionaceae bacterium]
MGGGLLFLGDVFRVAVKKPPSLHIVSEQIWRVTTQSVSTTAMAGFFVGAISTVQFTLQVKEFGALGYLGGLSTSGTIREVGPLLIAFMLSGKVGAFTSAELGTMRVTEQIDAIRCLGANPLQEIILPRFLGIIVSSFFLLAAGLMMSILGGLLMGMVFSGINPDEYLRHIPTIVTWSSIVSGLFKCFVFAFVLASICTYKGYTTTGGAKGVGRSVVNTAVATMVGIVVADWLTSFMGEIAMRLFLGE